MSLIKPRTRGKRMVQHRTRLDHENNETLYAYAAFIGENPEYVLNQLIDTVLAKDKEFVAWRREQPGSFTPRPPAPRHREGARRRVMRRDGPPVGVSAGSGEVRL